MSLRDQAAADLQTFLEDTAGFGVPITVTDPAGTSVELTGFSTDIGETIDPETGTVVTGRSASVALSLARLTTEGLGIPRGIADGSGKPWVVTFDDIEGNAHTFKVSSSAPDRAAGIVTCMLEAYRP